MGDSTLLAPAVSRPLNIAYTGSAPLTELAAASRHPCGHGVCLGSGAAASWHAPHYAQLYLQSDACIDAVLAVAGTVLGVKNVMDAIGPGLGLSSLMGRLRAQTVATEQHFGLLAPGERPSRPSPISSEFWRLPLWAYGRVAFLYQKVAL